MSLSKRISPLAWIPVLLGALIFLAWSNEERASRTERVSALTGPAPVVEATSPTGYAGGVRHLLIPEHNHDSMQWIAQTQQMLADGEWRVRHVKYDNAPAGRDVRSASPYRWWLGVVAGCQRLFSADSLAASVERAALWADPVLQLALLVVGTCYVARRFGTLAAALVAAGIVALFPFAGAFLSGQPEDHGLALTCAVASVLPLLAGIHSGTDASQPSVRRAFLIAGIIGGLGVWISVSSQVPVLAGIALGGLFAAWHTRPADAATPAARWPWRTWAAAGAATSFAAYLIEFFPGHLNLGAWPLDTGHPLYAVAWLGLGELLARFSAWIQRDKWVWNRRAIAIVVLAVIAVAAVPVAIALVPGRGFLTENSFALRLTKLPDSAEADNVLSWLLENPGSLATWATLLPLLVLVPAVWLLARQRADGKRRAAVAAALGPIAVALGFACVELRWWNMVDGMLLALLAALVPAMTREAGRQLGGWCWSVAAALVLLPGLIQLWPEAKTDAADAVTEIEVRSLIERDLAHWFATRAGPDGAVVFAPPDLTVALFYYGGLRGIGTPYAENEEGFNAAVRLAAASSPDEGQAVATNREVTHIVLPTWDRYLDEYARLGSKQPEFSLISMLHQWLAPRWLRPVAYQVPAIAGFPAQAVAIFEVVEVQDNATALSRLAEYFLEMGLPAQAVSVSRELEKSFPADVGAQVARAQVALARHDGPGLNDVMKTLLPALIRGDDIDLPWDRRLNLGFVLAQAKQADLARTQLQRCVDELDETRMRGLSALSLVRLLNACKAFGLEIADPQLRELRTTLLPAELRERL